MKLYKKNWQKYGKWYVGNSFPRIRNKLKHTESLAYKWLTETGMRIDLKKVHLMKKPDFISTEGYSLKDF